MRIHGYTVGEGSNPTGAKVGNSARRPYIKDHKKEMRRKAIERGMLHPIHPGTDEWYFWEQKGGLLPRRRQRRRGGKSSDAGHERPYCWIAYAFQRGHNKGHAARVAHARLKKGRQRSRKRDVLAPCYLRLWRPMRLARMRRTM